MTAVIEMTDADYAPRYFEDEFLGRLEHDYLKVELADPAWLWLIPRCQEGARYPDRHPSVELRDPMPRQRGLYPVCAGCAACRRRGRIAGHL